MTSTRAVAVALAVCVAVPLGGCSAAVRHPAITAGLVGGTLAFGTCKLASDSFGTCGLAAGGAGAFLGLIAAGAIWLGGDGHTVLVEEQAQPIPDLPDDGSPRRKRPAGPAAPEVLPALPPEPPPPPPSEPSPPPATP